jgi:hypothetical protein
VNHVPLILKRASASRSSGQWSDDDYDVLENGVVVGRISKEEVAPKDRAWMWASGHGGHIKRAAHGYEATREAAKPPSRRHAAVAPSCSLISGSSAQSLCRRPR